MQPSDPRSVSRRALFGATGVSALLALSGCSLFSREAATVTVTADAPPQPSNSPQDETALRAMVAKTRLQVQHLEGAVRADKRDRKLLTMLLADRRAHYAALQQEFARSIGETTSPETDVPAPTASADADPDDILAEIRGDAGQAQGMYTDAMAGASAYRAQLFASMAACMATHRMVLS